MLNCTRVERLYREDRVFLFALAGTASIPLYLAGKQLVGKALKTRRKRLLKRLNDDEGLALSDNNSLSAAAIRVARDDAREAAADTLAAERHARRNVALVLLKPVLTEGSRRIIIAVKEALEIRAKVKVPSDPERDVTAKTVSEWDAPTRNLVLERLCGGGGSACRWPENEAGDDTKDEGSFFHCFVVSW